MGYHLIVLALLVLPLFTSSKLEALGGRGGGGGGGRGGHAGARGGSHASGGGHGASKGSGGHRADTARSADGHHGGSSQRAAHSGGFPFPTMSRADQHSRHGAGRGDQSGARFSQGSPVNASPGSLPGARGSSLPGVGGSNLPGVRTTSLPGVKSSLPNLNRSHAHAAAQTSRQFRQNHPVASRNMFNRDFYRRHHLDPGYYYSYGDLWAVPTWYDTASWINIGSGYYANYYDDEGYAVPLSSQEIDAYALPPPPPQQNYPPEEGFEGGGQQGNWLNLGVFVVASSTNQAPFSDKVIQLSLSRDGYLSGTYYNMATDQAYPVEGAVNPTSQKATFKLSNNPESPTATTGLYNLTQNVATIQLYFPSGLQQTKVLVRLN